MTRSTRCGRRAFAVADDYGLPMQVYCAPGTVLAGDGGASRFLTVSAAEARQLVADGAVSSEDCTVTWDRCEADSVDCEADCDAPGAVVAFYVEPWKRETFSAAPSPHMVERVRLCHACACWAAEYPDPWLRIGPDAARDWGCA